MSIRFLNHAFKSHCDALNTQGYTPPTKEALYSVMDLTCLRHEATADDLHTLVQTGQQHRVAGLCVYPEHLKQIPMPSTQARITVVNFPEGQDTQAEVFNTIDRAITVDAADEIDYVFPYSLYLDGQQGAALAHAKAAYEHCMLHHKTFKIILETGVFPDLESIYSLSQQLIAQGCHFLKTSTGKRTPGATLPAVFAILSAMEQTDTPCGIKVSGGIKTIEAAHAYSQLAESLRKKPIHPSWFRLGTSQIF